MNNKIKKHFRKKNKMFTSLTVRYLSSPIRSFFFGWKFMVSRSRPCPCLDFQCSKNLNLVFFLLTTAKQSGLINHACLQSQINPFNLSILSVFRLMTVKNAQTFLLLHVYVVNLHGDSFILRTKFWNLAHTIKSYFTCPWIIFASLQ